MSLPTFCAAIGCVGQGMAALPVLSRL